MRCRRLISPTYAVWPTKARFGGASDRARLFNAAVALGIDASEIVQHVDSVSFCLSKGCALVGSLLCGSAEFIHRASYVNRSAVVCAQAGVLAAAGIVALEQMIGRLAEDHANARRLAHGLAQIPGIEVDGSGRDQYGILSAGR